MKNLLRNEDGCFNLHISPTDWIIIGGILLTILSIIIYIPVSLYLLIKNRKNLK